MAGQAPRCSFHTIVELHVGPSMSMSIAFVRAWPI